MRVDDRAVRHRHLDVDHDRRAGGDVDVPVDLPRGGAATVTITGTLPDDASGTLDSTARIDPAPSMADVNEADNVSTASAVVADLIDIARGEYGAAFAMPVGALVERPAADAGARIGRAYLRFTVEDKVGVLAEIAAAMRDSNVSIESLIQRGVQEDGSVLVAIVTHESPERNIVQALDRLDGSPSVRGKPMLMHILD